MVIYIRTCIEACLVVTTTYLLLLFYLSLCAFAFLCTTYVIDTTLTIRLPSIVVVTKPYLTLASTLFETHSAAVFRHFESD